MLVRCSRTPGHPPSSDAIFEWPHWLNPQSRSTDVGGAPQAVHRQRQLELLGVSGEMRGIRAAVGQGCEGSSVLALGGTGFTSPFTSP